MLTWYLLLGALFAGYLALAGYDYGVGLVLPLLGGDTDRRGALNAVGPLFLGNEVWIVAAIGVLFAAFPRAESELRSGGYPLVVAVVLGLVAVNAGVQLRSRPAAVSGRRRLDLVITLASLALALGWGALLGTLLTGRPGTLSWYPVLTALAFTAILVLHGAAFLAMRAPDTVRDRARRLAGRVLPVTLGLTVLAVGGGFLNGDVRAGAGQPLAGTVLAAALLGAVGLAGLGLAGRRYRLVFAATLLAAALPAFVVGVACYPHLLPDLTVAQAVAGPETLHLLDIVALPVLPVLLAAQVMSWWVYRHRPDRPMPVYW